MTEFQYKTANRIQEEIRSIDSLLLLLKSVENFDCDPPISLSGIALKHIHGEKECRQLTEGEAVYIKEALESKKAILQREFEKL